MYCVYLTIYRGNKLPPFYIGSTSIELITGKKQYKGSVASKHLVHIWKSELKINPQLFCVKILSMHDTRQEAYDAEDKLLRARNAVNSGFYMNARCAKGLGYHPKGSDSPRFKVPHTAEAKAKISKVHKNKKLTEAHKAAISAFNKARIVKPETCQKLSDIALSRAPMDLATRQKMSRAKLGKKQSVAHAENGARVRIGCKWWNNGVSNIFNKQCPGEEWVLGRLKMNGIGTKGKKWWNDGNTRMLTELNPGLGWKPGKMIK